MPSRKIMLAGGFCLLAGGVLFLALVPGSLGAIIENGVVRHALAFVTLTAFAVLAWPAVNQIVLWASLSLFGGSIEIFQGIMAYGREADWGDWIVDIAAVTATLAVMGFVRFRRHSAGRLQPASA